MVDPKLIQSAKRKRGWEKLSAVFGDGSGQPKAGNGLYWVRKIEGGRLSLPIKLPLAAGVALIPRDGVKVKIGVDDDGNQVIYPPGATALMLGGADPYASNPLDRPVQGPVKTTELTPFLCQRHGQFVQFPLTVVVFVPTVVKADGSVIFQNILAIAFDDPAGDESIDSLIPDAGLKCIAVVFWNDDNTLEAHASTPIALSDPLTNAHIQECIAASTEGSLIVWGWQLENAQTSLTADPKKNIDLRQFVNMPSTGGGSGMTSFTLAADTGTPAVIADAETVLLAGGTGIATSIAGNTVTIAVVYEAIQDMIAAFLAAGANITLTYNDAGDALTVAVSGLAASDISNFSEAVDDRVAALIVAGTNISSTYDDTLNTLTIAVTGLTAGSISGFNESVDDRVAALLQAGSNITLTYDDALNTLTIAVSGLTASTISDFSEAVDDRVAALAVAGSNISITYNDGSNTLTFAVTGLTAAQISDFSEAVDDRVAALLVAGANITLTYNDGANTFTVAVTSLDNAPIGATTPSTGAFTNLSATAIADYWRAPCRVLAVANVNVSSAPSSIDNVTLATGDRVYLSSQSTGSQNGIWVFNGAGNAMTRPVDFPNGSTVFAFSGIMIFIYAGDIYKGVLLKITNTGTVTIGTTTITATFVDGFFNSLALAGLGIGRIKVTGLTADRNWEMPNSSGNVLLDSAAQTVTNKTIDPASNTITGLYEIQAFGDGSDGNVTVSAPLTLTRDMYYANLTISAGAAITPAGYRIFVSGTLDISAAPASWIVANGGNGSANSGTTGGVAGASAASASIGGGAAATNGGNANIVPAAGAVGDEGGIGGNGGRSGGNAGTGGTATPTGWIIKRWAVDLLKGIALVLGGSGGTGGTGGNVGGGGGGGAGGIIYIAANTIARGTNTTANGIVANGGNGATPTNTGLASGGGGGGGGGGGWVFIIYKALTGSSISNHITASGGTGGSGSNGATTGGTGGTGGGGGRATKLALLAGTITETTGSAGSAGSANSGTTGGAGGAGNTFQASL